MNKTNYPISSDSHPSYTFVVFQETKQPLSAEKFNAIWEEIKELGVLVGKGGLNGTVSIDCTYK